eukprot:jgi/Tetstr1/439128/TSEL_027580.t1
MAHDAEASGQGKTELDGARRDVTKSAREFCYVVQLNVADGGRRAPSLRTPPRLSQPVVMAPMLHHVRESFLTQVVTWRWDNKDADPSSDHELLMKVIYTNGDEEDLTESEIQPLYLTIEQLRDFTRGLPQGAIDDLLLALRELLDADNDADSDAEGIVAGVVDGNPSDDSRGDNDGEGDAGARYDFSTWTSSARRKYDDDGKRRRQLYTSADATLMEAALNLCEWKLKHNIKTAAFERLSKLLKKHMLPKDGSELTETWCQDMPSSNRGEKRNMKSAEGALTVQDVYEVTDSDGNKSRARRDLQHQIYIGAFFADMPGRSKAISVEMRPKIKKMDRRMAMVTLTSDFGRPVRPMLPSAGTSGVVCADWTCEDCLHFAETVAVMVLGQSPGGGQGSTARDSELWMEPTMRDVKRVARGSGTTDTERAYGRQFREAAGADDAVDVFEGTGPGCRGAAMQAGTSGAPATWTDCEVALA